MPGPAAAAVPIVLAAGVIRMVAPTVARSLIKSGVAKEATKKMIDAMKGYIPKATKKQAENLAKTSSKGKTPTSAPLPKPTGAARRLESRARLKKERNKEKKEEAARKKNEDKKNQQKIIENLTKRNLPTKTNKPLAPTGGRNLPAAAARRKELQEQKQNPNKEKVNVNKSGTAAASRASQVATAGTENKNNKQNKKLKPVPEVNVRTLPEPKKVRSTPKKGDNKELDIIPPKRKKPTKVKKDKKADDGYRFYGKKGTGLRDFSEKYGMQYATQKQFEKDFDMSGGAKEGGSIKKLAKKKRKGFSGRGAGKALRGF